MKDLIKIVLPYADKDKSLKHIQRVLSREDSILHILGKSKIPINISCFIIRNISGNIEEKH